MDGEEPCVAVVPSREERMGRYRHESIGGEGSTRGKREATVATTWVCGLPNDGRGKMRWGFNRGEIGLPKGPSVRLKNPYGRHFYLKALY